MRISDWSSDVCSSDLALREFGGFLLKIGKFLFQIGEAVLRRRVGFFRQRFPFDLELDDTPVERFNLLGLALHLHAEAARCLVHRSAERRVGKEGGSTCRSRWSPDH